MNNDDSNDYSSLLSLLSFTPAGLIYNTLNSQITDEHLEYLKELAQRGEAKHEVYRTIEEWKKQPPHPKRTRVIVELINNTSTALKMSDSDSEPLYLDPHTCAAFKWEFAFTKPGPASPGDKVQLKESISLGNGSTHFRFDTSLALKSSFGVLSPTFTPKWTHSVVSTGATKVKCSSAITEKQTEAPYSYDVAITLG